MSDALPPLRDDIICASPSEHEWLESLRGIVRATAPGERLVLAGASMSLRMTESVAEGLRTIIEALASGGAVSVTPIGKELALMEASTAFHIPMPRLRLLTESGAIPVHMVGSRRMVRTEDVLAYRREQAGRRAAALDEASRLGQEMEEPSQDER
jgi:hypothetical protein